MTQRGVESESVKPGRGNPAESSVFVYGQVQGQDKGCRHGGEQKGGGQN